MFGNSLDKRILKLVEIDEKHDKANIVSSLELLKMLKKRFILMQDILRPLVDTLSKEMIVTNINFAVGLDETFSINISYVKDNKSGMIVLSQLGIDDLDLTIGTHDTQLDNLIMGNKNLIIKTLNLGLDESFDKDKEIIKSTSGLLLLSLGNQHCELNSSDLRDNTIQFRMYYDYSKESFIVTSAYKAIEDKFNENENINKFLSHVKVYEKNIPYYLSNKK